MVCFYWYSSLAWDLGRETRFDCLSHSQLNVNSSVVLRSPIRYKAYGFQQLLLLLVETCLGRAPWSGVIGCRLPWVGQDWTQGGSWPMPNTSSPYIPHEEVWAVRTIKAIITPLQILTRQPREDCLIGSKRGLNRERIYEKEAKWLVRGT